MTGSLSETDYASLREKEEDDQQSLSAFSNGESSTTIAVVRKPRDTGIEEVCDEWMQDLGMPEYALKKFWDLRAGYRTNSAVDNPNDKAYEDALLDARYKRHLQDSDEAQAAIDAIVRRLEDGEDITLVCFEPNGRKCHRHLLKHIIEKRVANGFRLSEEKLLSTRR